MLNGVMRRFTVIALALVMLLSLMPTFAFAAETDAEWIADNVTAGYDEAMFAAQPGTSDAKVTATQADDTAKFIIGTSGTTEYTLADALANLGSAKQITLSTSGTIYGTYTIPAGVTLCIPYDSTNTAIVTASEDYVNGGTAYSKPSVYKKLTMAPGSSLVVNGTLAVSSKLQATQAYLGSPNGTYGQIDMQAGSSITMQNGSVLFVWGYITGQGTIDAQRGAEVHEVFQIADFRGGTATKNMVIGAGCGGGATSKAFPFTQYYVQNIEARLTLQYGAVEKVAAAVYVSSSTMVQEIDLISYNNAMFIMKSGSTVTKYYDGTKDRLYFEVSGSVSLSKMTIDVSVASIDTSKYRLPVNSNITLIAKDGAVLSADYDVDLLPGAEVYIESGATLSVANGKKLNVYDRTEWVGNGFTDSNTTDLQVVGYSPTKTKTRTAADLVDAALYVNGTIQMNGCVYTTQSGADVTGRSYPGTGDSGKVSFANAAAPTESSATYQAVYQKDSPNFADTTITTYSAWLHNGPDASGTSYVQTQGAAQGSVYEWDPVSNTWLLNPVTVKYDNNDGSGLYSVQKIVKNQPTALGLSDKYTPPTQEGAELVWNTSPDGSGTTYTIGQSVTLSSDLTLYAYQKPADYTVTWLNADGTVLKTDENVAAGTMPKYTGATPTKADDTAAKVRYVFAGWDKTLAPVTGDVTYTATYTEAPLYYAVELYYDDAADPVYTKPETLYKNSLKLTAENPRNDGKQFSYWSIQYFDAQGNALGEAVQYPATQITVHPGVGGITVRARAIYGDETFVAKPFIKIIGAEFNPLTNKWSFTLTQSVPSGNASAVGFVMSTTNQMPALGGEGVIRTTSGKTLPTSTFTAHVSMDDWEGQTLYVRAYLTYNNVTWYSEDAVAYPYPGA